VWEVKVSTKELEVGMQLHYELHSRTGALLVKQKTIFDESSIEAVRRCLRIDPFNREIEVLLKYEKSD
jgi:hypothetical protein